MNQQCKVCGEPAAGFHFGAFTCEGCKSFFGRSYNNLSSISECKNNSECVINKKNRTACKACRLRKCLMVGMSKSGSRYGRRSNWFKIHCLLQEQQQQQQQQTAGNNHQHGAKQPQRRTPPPHHHHPGALGLSMLNQQFPPPLLHLPKTKEELMLLGLDDYNKHAPSPSVSSPESHNSDSSVEVSDARRIPIFPGFLPPSFLPPPNLLFPPGYPPLYPGLLQPVNAATAAAAAAAAAAANNNNNRMMRNHNPGVEAFSKRIFLDAVLQSQRTPTPPEDEARGSPQGARTTPTTPTPTPTPRPAYTRCPGPTLEAGPVRSRVVSPIQDDPIDLSMKATSERGSLSPARSEGRCSSAVPTDAEEAASMERGSEADEESDCDSERELKRIKLIRPSPLDLTTKV